MIDFCEKWLFAKSRPVRPIRSEAAEARHAKGHAYCAVIGGFDAPTHVVSLADDWVSVHFFDEVGRAYLNYDFKKSNGRLFLSMAVFREYANDSFTILRSVTFSFSADGSVLMSVDEQNEISESESQASVALNWAEYPAFGEYASLCDENRVS
jgi:hypothetical protein